MEEVYSDVMDVKDVIDVVVKIHLAIHVENVGRLSELRMDKLKVSLVDCIAHRFFIYITQ